MSAKELQNWINGLTQDITFEYLGVEGSILSIFKDGYFYIIWRFGAHISKC